MAFQAGDFKDRVKEATPLDRLVASYGVQLKRAGTSLKGICPFHEEKTPSFHVYMDPPQRYKCYGCGVAGDAFTFVQEMGGVDFREAVETLAEQAGIEVDWGRPGASPASQRAGGRQKEQKRYLYRLNCGAQAFFREQLEADVGQAARAYLAGRGLEPETVEAFELGYAPEGWDALVRHLGKSPSHCRALVAGGLARAKEGREDRPYDLFRDRLIFPIHVQQGPRVEIVAFAGRRLNDEKDEAKYVNTPGTPIFSKGRVLYGLARARQAIQQQNEALVVEGYTDVMMCAQHGIDNVVAPMGTAFGERHVALLSRLTQRVTLVFDADEAGLGAAEKAVGDCIAGELGCDVAILPGGADPCEILQKEGRDAFAAALEKRKDGFAFRMDQVCGRLDLERVEEKVAACEELMQAAARAPSHVARAEYRRRIAEGLSVSESSLRFPGAGRRAPEPPVSETPRRTRLQQAERDLMKLCLMEIGLFSCFRANLNVEELTDPIVKEVALALVHCTGDGGLPDVDRALSELGDGVKAKAFVVEGRNLMSSVHAPEDTVSLFDKALEGFERVKKEEELDEIYQERCGAIASKDAVKVAALRERERTLKHMSYKRNSE